MLSRVRFFKDEYLGCGHIGYRLERTRVIRSNHCARSTSTPVSCPMCGTVVRARFIRCD